MDALRRRERGMPAAIVAFLSLSNEPVWRRVAPCLWALFAAPLPLPGAAGCCTAYAGAQRLLLHRMRGLALGVARGTWASLTNIMRHLVYVWRAECVGRTLPLERGTLHGCWSTRWTRTKESPPAATPRRASENVTVLRLQMRCLGFSGRAGQRLRPRGSAAPFCRPRGERRRRHLRSDEAGRGSWRRNHVSFWRRSWEKSPV